MYQFAAGKALSLKLNSKLYLDTSWFAEIKGNPDVVQRAYELQDFHIEPGGLSTLDKLRLKLSPPTVFKEPDSRYRADFEKLRGNVLLDGYWQSYKYFKAYENQIQRAFSFPSFKSSSNKQLLKQITVSESVSVHVRRGDYNTKRGRAFHGLLPKTYYQQALANLEKNVKNPTLFVFSDEIEWCKKNFKFKQPAVFIDSNSSNTGVDDMHLMAACKHNIIANSSFSSWAAWLNTNRHKQVYAPKQWFASEKTLQDRLPPSWIIL
jgi:hypothetical protein